MTILNDIAHADLKDALAKTLSVRSRSLHVSIRKPYIHTKVRFQYHMRDFSVVLLGRWRLYIVSQTCVVSIIPIQFQCEFQHAAPRGAAPATTIDTHCNNYTYFTTKFRCVVFFGKPIYKSFQLMLNSLSG